MFKTRYELWSEKKLNPHHYHVWVCRVKERPYNLQSMKLNSKTINGYFIHYCISSRGSRFYCPFHTTKIIKSDCAIYFEDDQNSVSIKHYNATLREEFVVFLSQLLLLRWDDHILIFFS